MNGTIKTAIRTIISMCLDAIENKITAMSLVSNLRRLADFIEEYKEKP